MAKTYKFSEIADKNTNNFAKKPASGGIPAIENNIVAKQIPKAKLTLNNPL